LRLLGVAKIAFAARPIDIGFYDQWLLGDCNLRRSWIEKNDFSLGVL